MISAGIQANSVSGNEAALKAAGEALARDIQSGSISKATIKKFEEAGVDISSFELANNRFDSMTKTSGGIKAGLHAPNAPVSASIKGDGFETNAAFNVISKNPALAGPLLAGIVDELYKNS